jgi:hypothetical protein
LKPEVVSWEFLRMRSEKITKTPLECCFGAKFIHIYGDYMGQNFLTYSFSGMPVPSPRSVLEPEVVLWAFLRMRNEKMT